MNIPAVRFISLLFAVLLAACASQGPAQIEQDRFDYGSFLADSWKNQGLMNIVRMRYLDWPVFMEIQQLLTSYKWEILPAAKGEIKTPLGNSNQKLEALVTVRYAENPTILYRPLSGADYSKAMLSPARPGVLFALAKTGFPIDQLLRTSTDSLNGFNNDYLEDEIIHPASQEFLSFTRLMRILQVKNAISIDIRVNKRTTEQVTLKFKPDRMDIQTREQWENLKQQLGMASADESYRIVFGSASFDPKIIALRTRSIIQVMQTLSVHVIVPPEDLANDLVPKLILEKPLVQDEFEPLMKIDSGKEAPKDAYAAIQYRGNWFWIADTESRSKNTFQFLSLLLTITESGESGGGQVVIPAG